MGEDEVEDSGKREDKTGLSVWDEMNQIENLRKPTKKPSLTKQQCDMAIVSSLIGLNFQSDVDAFRGLDIMFLLLLDVVVFYYTVYATANKKPQHYLLFGL